MAKGKVITDRMYWHSNNRFTKIDAANWILGDGLSDETAELYSVAQKVDEALAVIAQMSYAEAGGFVGFISFSSILKDDLGLFDLAKYPTRITVPNRMRKMRIKLLNLRINLGCTLRGESYALITLSKNGVDTQLDLPVSGSDETGCFSGSFGYTWESPLIDVNSGDYFQLRFSRGKGSGVSISKLSVEISMI